jgi:hypothetical protein
MTNIDQQPGPAKAPAKVVSINDNLPTNNPSLRVVLTVFGCLVVVVLVLTFHKSLGLS